jgi:hypothetical protein
MLEVYELLDFGKWKNSRKYTLTCQLYCYDNSITKRNSSMRHYLIIAIVFLTASLYAADEDTKTQLPLKVEKSLHIAKVNILKEYQDEVSKLLKELEKSKTEATKAGNLKDANAIDKLIKEVYTDSLLTEIIADNKERAAADLLGVKETPVLLGKWEYSKVGGGNAILVFKEDGTIDNQWNEKWTYEIKTGKLIVHPVGSLSAEDMVFVYKLDKSQTLNGTQGTATVKLTKLP